MLIPVYYSLESSGPIYSVNVMLLSTITIILCVGFLNWYYSRVSIGEKRLMLMKKRGPPTFHQMVENEIRYLKPIDSDEELLKFDKLSFPDCDRLGKMTIERMTALTRWKQVRQLLTNHIKMKSITRNYQLLLKSDFSGNMAEVSNLLLTLKKSPTLDTADSKPGINRVASAKSLRRIQVLPV